MPSNKAVVYGKDVSTGLYEITGRPEECWARIGDRLQSWPTRCWPTRVGRARPLSMTGMWRMAPPAVTGRDHEFEALALGAPAGRAEGAQGPEWTTRADFRPPISVSDEESNAASSTAARSTEAGEYELYRDLGMTRSGSTYKS